MLPKFLTPLAAMIALSGTAFATALAHSPTPLVSTHTPSVSGVSRTSEVPTDIAGSTVQIAFKIGGWNIRPVWGVGTLKPKRGSKRHIKTGRPPRSDNKRPARQNPRPRRSSAQPPSR